MHEDVGSMHAGWTQNPDPRSEFSAEVRIRVGETTHLRERSKSESII